MKASKDMVMVDKFIDFRYKGKIYNAKLFYKGYFSRLYKFSDGRKEYLVKFYVDNKYSNNVYGVSVQKMLEREIKGFERLNSVDNMDNYGVVVPKIVFVNMSEKYYVMDFIDYVSFNKFLFKNANVFHYNPKLDEILVNFGRFIAVFHNKNRIKGDVCHLHGDMNYKNIGFFKDKLVLIDPSSYSSFIKRSQYYEIGRILVNFFPSNLIYLVLVGHKSRMIKMFLKGYISETDISFSFDKLLKCLRHIIFEIKTIKMSKRILYQFKYYYIFCIYSLILNKLVKLIKMVSYYEKQKI